MSLIALVVSMVHSQNLFAFVALLFIMILDSIDRVYRLAGGCKQNQMHLSTGDCKYKGIWRCEDVP